MFKILTKRNVAY